MDRIGANKLLLSAARYTVEDGLPHCCIPNVAVADRDTIYIGPYYPTYYGEGEPGASLYRVLLREDGIDVEDIMAGEDMLVAHTLFASGPGSSLWVASWDGVLRYDGAEWRKYQYSSYLELYPYGDICFGGDGSVNVNRCDRGVSPV